MLSKVEELKLISRCVLADDRRAFGELVEAYQPRLRRFFMNLTLGDEYLSDDLAQETFIKAYIELRSFRGMSRFGTWLFRIGYNEFYSYNEYLPEGSTFIRELRAVHPFESYMMSTAANAKDMFSIFEDLTTAIKQLPMIGEDGNKHIRIYNMEGQLVKEARNVSEKEALKGLRHGLYIVNGKKRIIK